MAGEMKELAHTELGQAIIDGELKTIKKLIQDNAKLHFMDRKNNNYLHFICTMYRPYVFNVLAASGLDLNARNKYGHTPLHITAIQHEGCHVPDLMLYGINPYIKDMTGKQAKDMTKDSKWHSCYRAYEPGLRQAIIQHDIDRVEELLKCWSACHIIVDGKEVRHLAAGLGYYNIVSLVDKYRFTILAACSVMESNYRWLEYAISRDQDCDVNHLQQIQGRRNIHMMQHAIRLKDQKLVNLLLDGGADINTPVHIKDYVLAPLYFEGIYFHSSCDDALTCSLFNHGADFTLRDERGRSALIYAIDRRNGTSTKELVEDLMERGVSIAMRDNTGCSARDIAVLARRTDIVHLIDKFIIQLVKDSRIDTLWDLVVDGYTSIIFQFQYRDSWIYAAGNENEDASIFLKDLCTFQHNVKYIHYYIVQGDLPKMQDIMLHDDFPHRLLFFRDKGGRGALLKALLYFQWEIAEYILLAAPFIVEREIDSHNRTALHYALAGGKDGQPIVKLLTQHGVDRDTKDVLGLTAEELSVEKPNFLQTEREAVYGLETELDCMEKYEELLEVIRSKHKGLKHFDKVLKTIKFPLSEFPNMFDQNSRKLTTDYRDLLLSAIDNGKEDIAKKLMHLGVDSFRFERYPQNNNSSGQMMDALDRANHHGMTQLSDFIENKRQRILQNSHLYDRSNTLLKLDRKEPK